MRSKFHVNPRFESWMVGPVTIHFPGIALHVKMKIKERNANGEVINCTETVKKFSSPVYDGENVEDIRASVKFKAKEFIESMKRTNPNAKFKFV